MNLVFIINGREAIPVRAIPFVTGWEVSPDILSASLAHTAKGIRLEKLSAYQLLPAGAFAPILPKEWDNVDAELQALSANLRAKNSDSTSNRPEWVRKSIPLLPAGVFVWKDEFEKEFWRQFSPDSTYGVINLDGTRPGDGELNYAPLIPDGLYQKVCKGFPLGEIVQELSNCFSEPLSDLPQQQRDIAEQYIPEWSELSASERRTRAEEIDQQQAAELVGWHNQTLAAGMWWSLSAVAPKEAAMLLCHFNPQGNALDPLEITSDETTPDDFKRILRVFEDVARSQPQDRRLSEWHDIAHDRRLKHDPWIDAYRRAVTKSAQTTENAEDVSRDVPENGCATNFGTSESDAQLAATHAVQSDAQTQAPKVATPEITNDEAAAWLGREIIRKRNALVAELEGIWPSIERDLKDSVINNLSPVARATKFGYWNVGAALKWAAERKKIERPKAEAVVRSEGESDLSFLLRATLKLEAD